MSTTLASSHEIIVERAAIGIARVGLNGAFLEVNPCYCTITGYPAEELIGKTFQEITYEEDLAPDIRLLNKALLGNQDSFQMEKRYRRKNGDLIWTSLTASLVRDELGAPAYFVSTVQDISERKNMEWQLQQLNSELEMRVARKTRKLADTIAELEMARKIADENSQAAKAFLAYMSHELRAPIGVILGYAELIEDRLADSGDDVKGWLQTIQRNGDLLLRLVNTNLDISKADAGKIDIERENIDVVALVRDVMNGLELQAKNRRNLLQLESPETLGMSTDPHHLRQVMYNLIGNALKFTEAGTVNVRIRTELEAGVRCIVIEVRDTGIGMSAQQAQKLFVPYTQADRAISRKFGGTGLGLMLAKKLAQAMGGNVRLLESLPGKGSCFEVRIREF